jgi:hypothetical protein
MVAHRIPTIDVASIEFSESIQPAIHHCMTLWALGSDMTAHEHAYEL